MRSTLSPALRSAIVWAATDGRGRVIDRASVKEALIRRGLAYRDGPISVRLTPEGQRQGDELAGDRRLGWA